jgi:hypothetical protein
MKLSPKDLAILCLLLRIGASLSSFLVTFSSDFSKYSLDALHSDRHQTGHANLGVEASPFHFHIYPPFGARQRRWSRRSRPARKKHHPPLPPSPSPEREPLASWSLRLGRKQLPPFAVVGRARVWERFRLVGASGNEVVGTSRMMGLELRRPHACWWTAWTRADVGITLRVTVIALSCPVQLEAHEDTRWQDGPLGRCRRGFLEENKTKRNRTRKV